MAGRPANARQPRFRPRGNDPGKRTGGFDFNYRVPFVRNWLSIYADSLSDPWRENQFQANGEFRIGI
jgi:hypothetical protein